MLACVVTGLGLLLPRCGGLLYGIPIFSCKRKKKKKNHLRERKRIAFRNGHHFLSGRRCLLGRIRPYKLDSCPSVRCKIKKFEICGKPRAEIFFSVWHEKAKSSNRLSRRGGRIKGKGKNKKRNTCSIGARRWKLY